MKGLLFILVSLALTKVGAQEYIRQQSAHDTIMLAYREHAVAGCRHQAFQLLGLPARTARKRYKAWSQPASVKLSIGQPDLNVSLWETSHPEWSRRYRDPFLVVTFETEPARFVCTYNIARSTAVVEKIPLARS